MMRPVHIAIILLNCFWVQSLIAQQSDDPVRVILDTDMGSDCDDVGAMALLHQYADEGKVSIAGIVYSSGVVPYGVGIIDAINHYYGRADIPIGAAHDTLVGDPRDKMQAEKLSRDTVAFKNKYIHNLEVPEQTAFLRKLLSEEEDGSIVYITIGHTKALYDLLVSPPDEISELSGTELVKKKISSWVALGGLGAYNEEGRYAKEWNFFFNGTVTYTDYLVDHFPMPTFFIDAGRDIKTSKSLIDTPPGNIVRTAYRDWLWNVEEKTLADQRPSWDLMGVYFAVEGPGKYFDVFTNGYLDLDPDRGCRWIREKDPKKQHHFALQKKGYNQEIEDYLNDMISRKGRDDE